MAYTPASGNNGRIYEFGNETIISGFYKWTLKKNTKAVIYLHFESPNDADGNYWEQNLQGGSSGDVTLEGYIDTFSATATDSGTPALRNGLLVILSLVLIKGTPWGFNQIAARCTDYEVSSDITSDKPATYKASFKTSGIVGSTTTVTG
jgi:hypothetical protein